nr:hypothetical protein [Deltaproteobacteria bacterium]
MASSTGERCARRRMARSADEAVPTMRAVRSWTGFHARVRASSKLEAFL